MSTQIDTLFFLNELEILFFFTKICISLSQNLKFETNFDAFSTSQSRFSTTKQFLPTASAYYDLKLKLNQIEKYYDLWWMSSAKNNFHVTRDLKSLTQVDPDKTTEAHLDATKNYKTVKTTSSPHQEGRREVLN